MAAKDKLAALLLAADIEIDGGDPWDVRVHDERFYERVLSAGTLGAGESYMDGWWDVPQLDEFFARVHQAKLDRKLMTAGVLAQVVLSKIRNLQGRHLSTRVARRHYDLSNDLYVAMLDPTMQYTGAYYGTDGVDRTLDEAQLLKLDLIARKLHLRPGMTVLELGGGFGGLARHLAQHHQCRVVSYNISREQVEFARAWCDRLPVEFRLQDYLWRWDTDWFWCSRNVGAHLAPVRLLAGPRLLSSVTYQKLMRAGQRYPLKALLHLRPRTESVIQDVDIPLAHAASFLGQLHARVGITPVWVCPFRVTSGRYPLYRLRTDTPYVNFGFWDTVRSREPDGHYNAIVEQLVAQHEGKKSLYSRSTFEEQEFWAMYDRRAYETLKCEYDQAGRFPGLYEKTVGRG